MMKIVFLADHPEFMAELAGLHFAEWSYLNPGESLADRIGRLKSLCGRNGVPSFVIAIEGAELLGSASLMPRDMDNRPELGPWLADVFVKPHYRGRGIATSLVKCIEAEAKSAGITKLYLYTPDAVALYRRLGWVTEEECKYKGTNVIIMSKTIK
jgi:GNAT superfamily N-acetyltransferase